MRKNKDRLNHALHNESACDYLELKQEFPDWMITTAFYAALQFVSYKIFPFEVGATGEKKMKVESVDDYYQYVRNRNISKHSLLADLVGTRCSEISPDYDWLLSMSMTARYLNYQQDRRVAEKARTLMKKIKNYCAAGN